MYKIEIYYIGVFNSLISNGANLVSSEKFNNVDYVVGYLFSVVKLEGEERVSIEVKLITKEGNLEVECSTDQKEIMEGRKIRIPSPIELISHIDDKELANIAIDSLFSANSTAILIGKYIEKNRVKDIIKKKEPKRIEFVKTSTSDNIFKAQKAGDNAWRSESNISRIEKVEEFVDGYVFHVSYGMNLYLYVLEVELVSDLRINILGRNITGAFDFDEGKRIEQEYEFLISREALISMLDKKMVEKDALIPHASLPRLILKMHADKLLSKKSDL